MAGDRGGSAGRCDWFGQDIRDSSKSVLVAAEFKCEPAHHRPEFQEMQGKLPVVFWDK
jgi:hypothetical protein